MIVFWTDTYDYLQSISTLEFLGLVFGLINVLLLIRQNILTWPAGLVYVFISFIIFWKYQLYGDFLLHIIFLILNIYGWWIWHQGKDKSALLVSELSLKDNLLLGALSTLGIIIFGFFLTKIHFIWPDMEPASVPYWDATTSILSVTGIWLMAKKKIENWYYWLIVDILASGIYFHKGIYFYSLLYGFYIILAITGLLAWKKTFQIQDSK